MEEQVNIPALGTVCCSMHILIEFERIQVMYVPQGKD